VCKFIFFDFNLRENLPRFDRSSNAAAAVINLLYFFHFHQVFHCTDHTQDLRSSFHFFGSVHLFQTESP
jgi:hypothetical protein